MSLDEYKQLIESNQTDKERNLIYLYTTDKTAQFSYIKNATEKGYDVLVINDQLSGHFVGLLEQKLEKSHFVRVDSDIIDKIIVKEAIKSVDMTDSDRNAMTTLFKSQIPNVEKSEFIVSFESLLENDSPVQITQSEYMRRMKEMAAMQHGMAFFGEMPNSYNLILNVNHPVVKNIINNTKANLANDSKTAENALTPLEEEVKTLRDKKDASDEEKKVLSSKEAEMEAIRSTEEKAIKTYADSIPTIRQLIDIALLSNNLLKGEQLDAFLKRSVDLLK